jgi:hypothetical protein
VIVACRQIAQLPIEALAAGVVLPGRAPAVPPPVPEALGNALEERIVRIEGVTRVCASIRARVFRLSASSSWLTSAFAVFRSTSTNTGTQAFWMIRFTVVEKQAATVITSSPGFTERSSFELIRAENATTFALDPILTRSAHTESGSCPE